MQHLPLMQVMQRAIRAAVCTQCYQRPEGSENISAEQPRECEGQCTIFENLARLKAIADRANFTHYESAIRERICQKCEATPTAGDFCMEGMTRSCPLSRYGSLVLNVLERVKQSA